MTQTLRQLTRLCAEIWKQLGVNQRVSLVLGTAVVLAGLIGLTIWSSRPDFVLLYGKLDDGEAARVMAALDDAKVPYKSGRGGSSILVPSDKVYPMRAQLAAKGIPRGEGVGFEIFDKPNFGISDFVQRANYLRAVQGELARTIGQIDLVESARVMIVMPENRLLVDNQKKPTASVFVRTKSNGQLSPSAVNSIRFLVANAVEGLQANNVSIVDHLGNVLTENQENDTAAGLSNNQLTARRNLEAYLAKKAEGMLEKALGPGQAIVRVSTDINWDTVTRTEEKYDPDGQVARSTTLNDETTTTSTADANGGAAGVASNVANADTNGPSASPVSNSQTKKKVTQSQYELSRVLSNTMLAAGGIKRLSAAVFIAQKMDGTGAARKPVPRTDDEIQKLKRIVQGALGISEEAGGASGEGRSGSNLSPQTSYFGTVTLEQIPFNDQPGLDLTQRLDTDSTRQFYWDIARNGLFALLALAILIIFLRLLKKTSNEITEGELLGQLDQLSAAQRESAKPGGMVTVEALNALIRDNPASVGQAVRSWLGSGTGGKSN